MAIRFLSGTWLREQGKGKHREREKRGLKVGCLSGTVAAGPVAQLVSMCEDRGISSEQLKGAIMAK